MAGRVMLITVLLACIAMQACAITTSQLPAAIDAIIAQSQYARSQWGVLIGVQNDTATNGFEVLYNRQGEQFFTPASNCKVLTTAAFFAAEGPGYAHDTPVRLNSDSSEVCLYGQGDATWVQAVQHKAVAQKLSGMGIDEVALLHVDNTLFPQLAPPTWEWEDLEAGYGARPNSVITEQNGVTFTLSSGADGSTPKVTFASPYDDGCVPVSVDVTVSGTSSAVSVFYNTGNSSIQCVGSMPSSTDLTFNVASLQPAERFACTLSGALEEAGISVKGYTTSDSCSSSEWADAFSVPALPTSITMNYTLQESDNLFAECFLRTLGVIAMENGTVDSMPADQAGLVAVKQQLSAIGVDTDAFTQTDGSGLSRRNLVSPESLVMTLVAMKSVPNFSIYRTFLPVGGESGTLKSRFVGTAAQGRVHAKTGTETGVNALSGYMDASDNFPEVVFSIIVNQSNQSSSVVRAGMDDIVNLLAELEW